MTVDKSILIFHLDRIRVIDIMIYIYYSSYTTECDFYISLHLSNVIYLRDQHCVRQVGFKFLELNDEPKLCRYSKYD